MTALLALFFIFPGGNNTPKQLNVARNSIKSTATKLVSMIPEPNFFKGTEIAKVVNYTELLNTIAKGESKGNYNAYYGKVNNTSTDFTSMTVNDVLQWQSNYVKNGSPSSAVGKYQFIRPTLDGLVKEKGIDRNAKFDEKLQDKLAVALLERRGLNDYAKGKISREQFAHNLSKEWAALPKAIGDKPHASYYAGDGLNKVRISIDEIYNGIDSLDK